MEVSISKDLGDPLGNKSRQNFIEAKKLELLRVQKKRKINKRLHMELSQQVVSVRYKGVAYPNASIYVKNGIATIMNSDRKAKPIAVLKLFNGSSPGEAISNGNFFEVSPVDPDCRHSPTIVFQTLEEAEGFVNFVVTMMQAMADDGDDSEDSGSTSN